MNEAACLVYPSSARVGRRSTLDSVFHLPRCVRTVVFEVTYRAALGLVLGGFHGSMSANVRS